MIILIIFYLFFATSVEGSNRTLCADIGGSRIKAAILHPGISLEELRQTPFLEMSSQQWLNEFFPNLFDPHLIGSISQKISSSYDLISFGISGPVVNSRLYINPLNTVPRELKNECEKIGKCTVFIENDVIIWGRGAIYWQNLIGKKMTFPCLGITLGTGVGVVLLTSPHDICNIDISYIDITLRRLQEISQEQPAWSSTGKLIAHELLGNPFFDWAKREHPEWSEKILADTYNKRVIAFLKDMQEFIKTQLNTTPHIFMIGGGNSRFIKYNLLHKKLNKKLLLLNPQALALFNISPNAISLLGCIAPELLPPSKMIPAWE